VNRRAAAALALALALAVAGCISSESWEATRVLKDIMARGSPSDLKSMTPAPSRTEIGFTVEGRAHIADLYHPNQPVGARLVLIPGFTRQGKDDARLVDLATSLTRARFMVLVPDLAGSREIRVRLQDADDIADAIAWLAQAGPNGEERVGVAAISYAVVLAVQATERPRAADRIAFVAGIGGLHDSAAAITFMTTGKYRAPGEAAWRTGHPFAAAKWLFLEANLDAVQDPIDREALSAIADRRSGAPEAAIDDLTGDLRAEGRALLELTTNADAERVPALLAALPAAARRQIQNFALKGRDLSHLKGRLILIHGAEDTMIPHTESAALAASVPDSELYVIDGFSHIDPTHVPILGQWQLIGAVQAILRRRQH
jgi:pimeloyl-ACP methyl ester carboxylesterase